MEQKAYRRSRTGKPMADILRDRQNRFLPRQRLAQNIREEARSGPVRRARSDANRWQPQGNPVEESTATVIGEKKLAYCFLGPVARERLSDVVIGNCARQRGAVNGDR